MLEKLKVHAQEDWPGFGEKVWEVTFLRDPNPRPYRSSNGKAMSTDTTGKVDERVSTKLYAGYQQLSGQIHS